MMSDNNDFGAFFAGLIVGGLVGAATALLLAPQSGEETRQWIQDRGIELKDRAVEYGADARARATAALDDARARADQALEEVRYRQTGASPEKGSLAQDRKAPAAAEEPPAAL
jgi:gas vesicle protein